MAAKKTAVKAKKVASVTLEELVEGASNPLPVKIGDTIVGYMMPKQFSTGSYGLSFFGKCMLPLANGKVANCQAAFNATVIGSKP